MKKLMLFFTVVLVLLTVLCICFMHTRSYQTDKLNALCHSSITAAKEHFANYAADGKEQDYLAGIAEFRAYMTAYQALAEDEADTEYLWCNTLYGYMTMKPDRVKAYCAELAEALSLFSEIYDHPNGFQKIAALNNRLNTES